MQAPTFWQEDASGRDAAPMLQALAAPLSVIYAAGAAWRRSMTKPARAPVKIICVGNLTLGGAGKTPVARALRAKLGPKAAVLLRGYGGAAKGVVQAAPESDVRIVGDEALLHAADGLTFVSRDRVAGALAAKEAGAELVILDDGHQNHTIEKDLSLVVIDAESGIGNCRVFHAGPLRERLRF
ncbi:MAG: tetraacyldisaccharide 4'-kinase [Hyphomonadaceae bacterium]